MAPEKSRNSEEVEKFFGNIPLLDLVCRFDTIDDGVPVEELRGVIEERLTKVKMVNELVENWKRKL